MILAGDIGGTSTRLGLFEANGDKPRLVLERTYPSRLHSGLDEIVTAFISANNLKIEQACFGIAGPVLNGRVETSNLAWVVDSRVIAREMAIPSVTLINDLEANAFGIGLLNENDFVTLNTGAPGAVGNAAVISAGTGLGEAGLYWDGHAHHPFACEGGHADFAPRSDLEAELLLYLRSRFEHVSYERVLSGPGLHVLYEFLRDTGRGKESPAFAEELRQGDPSAAISEAAQQNRCEICVQALDLFISFYGAEAGNLALKMMATGGVYIGGGIAPKIVARMSGPVFLPAFCGKGRMRPLLESMPIRVIMNETTALLGAARCAALPAATSNR